MPSANANRATVKSKMGIPEPKRAIVTEADVLALDPTILLPDMGPDFAAKIGLLNVIKPDAVNWLISAFDANRTFEGRQKELQEQIARAHAEKNDELRLVALADKEEMRGGKITKVQIDLRAERMKMVDHKQARILALQKQMEVGFMSVHPLAINALKAAPLSKLVPVEVDAPILAGETPVGNFSAIIEQIAECEAARKGINGMSRSLDDTLSAAFAEVDHKAEVNPPNILPLFNSKQRGASTRPRYGEIIWPRDYSAEALGLENTMDDTGLLFWASADQIKERLRQDITAAFDPSRSMSTQDKADALAKIDAEICDLEYLAAAYAMKTNDFKSTFRIYSNPLAILGVAVSS